MSNVLNMVSEQKFEAQTDKIAAAITAAGDGTVDTAMSDSSTNAVQNKVIKAYVDAQSGGGATVIPLILTESGLTSETTYKEAFDASLQGVVIFTYGLGDSQARNHHQNGGGSGGAYQSNFSHLRQRNTAAV